MQLDIIKQSDIKESLTLYWKNEFNTDPPEKLLDIHAYMLQNLFQYLQYGKEYIAISLLNNILQIPKRQGGLQVTATVSNGVDLTLYPEIDWRVKNNEFSVLQLAYPLQMNQDTNIAQFILLDGATKVGDELEPINGFIPASTKFIISDTTTSDLNDNLVALEGWSNYITRLQDFFAVKPLYTFQSLKSIVGDNFIGVSDNERLGVDLFVKPIAVETTKSLLSSYSQLYHKISILPAKECKLVYKNNTTLPIELINKFNKARRCVVCSGEADVYESLENNLDKWKRTTRYVNNDLVKIGFDYYKLFNDGDRVISVIGLASAGYGVLRRALPFQPRKYKIGEYYTFNGNLYRSDLDIFIQQPIGQPLQTVQFSNNILENVIVWDRSTNWVLKTERAFTNAELNIAKVDPPTYPTLGNHVNAGHIRVFGSVFYNPSLINNWDWEMANSLSKVYVHSSFTELPIYSPYEIGKVFGNKYWDGKEVIEQDLVENNEDLISIKGLKASGNDWELCFDSILSLANNRILNNDEIFV
jgi:hypothetical protein